MKETSYWSQKNVVVTGGAGFLGSYLVEYLLQDGAKVTVVDNLSSGKLENLDEVKDDIYFINADLRDPSKPNTIFKGADVVINMAASIGGIHYNSTHHAQVFTDNILINTHTIEAAHRNNVPRYTVISSACIYPADAAVPTPESEGERDRPEPNNEGYGWAKRMGEIQGQYYAREYGMEIAICRPFNAYGLRDHFDQKISHVIPALIKRILDGEDPLVVWGSGEQTRVFVHASDLAKAIEKVTEKYACADAVNIGHDQEISIKDLVFQILYLTNQNPRVVFDTTKPEGFRRRAADVTKLKKVTNGFTPKVALNDGLIEMIDYYKRVCC